MTLRDMQPPTNSKRNNVPVLCKRKKSSSVEVPETGAFLSLTTQGSEYPFIKEHALSYIGILDHDDLRYMSSLRGMGRVGPSS